MFIPYKLRMRLINQWCEDSCKAIFGHSFSRQSTKVWRARNGCRNYPTAQGADGMFMDVSVAQVGLPSHRVATVADHELSRPRPEG